MKYVKFFRAAIFILALGAISWVQAQVFKCVDENNGKITFTDKACPDKGAGDYVPVGPANVDTGYPSGSEIAHQQRKRAAQERANMERWQNAAADVADRERAQAAQQKRDRLYEQARREKDPAKRSALLRQAGAGNSNPAQPTTPMPMPVPQPSVITNCDPAGCWDNAGNRYNKGAGTTYFRSDGKTCQGVGGNMQCN